jgi:hypothetical protein
MFWGCFDWFDSHENYIGEVCVNFYLELNAVGIFSIPTDENP